jgi:TonB family protein
MKSFHYPILIVAVSLALASGIGFSSTPAVVFGQEVAQSSGADRETGIKLIGAGRTAEALDALKKATRKNKADAEAWYYLGVVYIQLKDFKKASGALETATKIRPDLAEAHNAFAYALLRRSKLLEANREADKSLAITPKNPDAHYTLGLVKYRTGARAEAIKHADLAIEQKPDFAEAYLLKSQALVSFNGDVIIAEQDEAKQDRAARYSQAAGSLERYLQLTPDSEEKQVWRDQLESLTFYLSSKPGTGRSNGVYPGSAVTTKARLLSKPEPVYTEEARNSRITGTVILKAVFASDGTVGHILVVQAIGGGLTERAVRAARRIKFVPATLNGKAVSMFMQLEYNFNLY